MENIIYFGKNILTGDIRKLKLSTDTSTSSYGIARYVDADGNDWGQEGLPNLGTEIIAVRTSGTNCTAKINGCNVDLDDIAPLMDNDIREDVHADLAPCEPQEFADEYCKRHFAKFGKNFLEKIIMEKISNMGGSALRQLLGIGSVVDSTNYDAWDAAHPCRDYHSADDRREYLIRELGNAAYEDDVDTWVDALYHSITDYDDARAVAAELVNVKTWHSVWDGIQECLDTSCTDNYHGIDAYIEACTEDLAKMLTGQDGISQDELDAIFREEK